MFSCRNIREIDIAFSRSLIPTEHRVDSFRQLGAARFVYTTAVDPEVVETVFLSLFTAKLDLSIARFALQFARVTSQIFKSDFLVIQLPSMRKDGIIWSIVTTEGCQAEGAIGVGM